VPTGDVKLPEAKLQPSNERNCTVSLLSVAATHPTVMKHGAMEIRDAPEPVEAFLSSVASMHEPIKEAESVFKDSVAANVGRHAAYTRLSVGSLSAVC
jgi:hypothetical protein